MCRWKLPSAYIRARGSRSNQTTKARSGLIAGLAALLLVLSLVLQTSILHAKESREVLGFFENNKELGAIEVIVRGDKYLFPLKEFAPLVGAKIESGADGKTVYFSTKIGRIKIESKYLSEIDRSVFVHQNFL